MQAQTRSLQTQLVHGQGLVEYALILVLIAIVTIGALTMLGRSAEDVYEQINCTLSNGTMRVDNGNGNSNRCSLGRGGRP